MASTSRKKSRRGPTTARRSSKARSVRRPTAKPRKPTARRAPPHKKAVAKKAARPKPKIPGKAPPPRKVAPAPEAISPSPTRPGDGRRHVLSLSFLRDGDEFLARIETDAGQITEFKHRVLDQLLSLVASELEDLLE
ncbi:MAG: hypothetical protein HKL79_00270 [Thermoplasmata archaeon]|nr:hypothetical protein [Thermoplasmata archaeon]